VSSVSDTADSRNLAIFGDGNRDIPSPGDSKAIIARKRTRESRADQVRYPDLVSRLPRLVLK